MSDHLTREHNEPDPADSAPASPDLIGVIAEIAKTVPPAPPAQLPDAATYEEFAAKLEALVKKQSQDEAPQGDN